MREPERSLVWHDGYRAGLEAGVRLATETVARQLDRQREALGVEPYHGPELAHTDEGPSWLAAEGRER